MFVGVGKMNNVFKDVDCKDFNEHLNEQIKVEKENIKSKKMELMFILYKGFIVSGTNNYQYNEEEKKQIKNLHNIIKDKVSNLSKLEDSLNCLEKFTADSFNSSLEYFLR